MGQNPVTPVNIPIPTKIGSKMGGAPTPKFDLTSFDPQPFGCAVCGPQDVQVPPVKRCLPLGVSLALCNFWCGHAWHHQVLDGRQLVLTL